MVDCKGLDLSISTAQEIEGIWAEAQKVIGAEKPVVAHGCLYGTAPVTPVTGFGWQIDTDEIVIVGATLHVHVKDDDTATVLDVTAS